ncbi:hypothetical protein D9613_001748 [Agrocybe pediades]|uniref:Large ribosomal subunit protein uL4m n=1 Tax=Agrocybe pediades TaxID=84607 RepID=A0A8H4R8A9_9AGAR|nr:hypothetical protein D9613_001748 [Agrocybe pediades]
MFRTTASVSRIPSRASRTIKHAKKPVVNVKRRPAVQQQAQPINEPVFLALTPSLRRGRWDPPADKSVAVLEPTVFKHPIRRDILHLCVVQHLDGLRQGSANTKTRGEVRGSGIKIRRQKGSGKARLGDGQSPMLRGGGVAFGPKPRDFSTKLPRKVIEMGMRVALSAKLKEQRLGVMRRLYWPNARTKFLSRRIEDLGLRKTLFISGEPEVHDGLDLAIRNIPHVKLTTTADVTVYDILKWDRIVLDLKAVQYFEETLKRKNIPTVPLSHFIAPVTSEPAVPESPISEAPVPEVIVSEAAAPETPTPILA